MKRNKIVKEKELCFKEFVNSENWDDFDTHLIKSGQILEEDLKTSIQYRNKLKTELSKDKSLKNRFKKVPEEKQNWARNQLYNSNVAAVDGTCSKFPLISGLRCRIGVVVTSYKNDRIEKVLFISERKLSEPSSSAMEHFKKLLEVQRISNVLIQAIMLYKERELILQRSEEWKFVHGELIPFELRTGLGKLRALPETLEITKKIIENKKVIGVIEESSDLDLLNAASILNKNEYMYVRPLKNDMNRYLETAHFNPDDTKLMKSFINNYASHIGIGIFKTGLRPYIFQAHLDNFDDAAALVMEDAKHQSMRGFPLLIDYADQICSNTLSQKEFEQQIMFKIAKMDWQSLGFELSPRKTRRR